MSDGMTRNYVRALVVWAVTLAGLYVFQWWFTR